MIVLLIFASILIAVGVYVLMFMRPKEGGDDVTRMNALIDKSNIKATRFGARKETKVMQAQTELLEMTNRANEALVRPQIILDTQRRDLENIQLERAVIDLAYQEGLPLDVLRDKLQKRELDELELQRIAKEVGIHLKAGLIVKLQAYQAFYVIREQLDGKYDTLDHLRSLPDTAANRSKIVQCEKDIAALEEDVHGRREEILRPRRRQELQGSDSDSDMGGRTPPTRIGTLE